MWWAKKNVVGSFVGPILLGYTGYMPGRFALPTTLAYRPHLGVQFPTKWAMQPCRIISRTAPSFWRLFFVISVVKAIKPNCQLDWFKMVKGKS